MKYLITGGSGFLGTTTADEALRQGADVRVLSRDDRRARDALPPAVDVVKGDVRDRASLDAAVAGIDRVLHLASDFRELEEDEQRSRDVNVGGTRHVLESASAHSVKRVVHCSTIGIHGSLAELPGTEDSPIRPGDITYERHKAEAEEIALSFQSGNGLEVTVVRPGGIYGPGDLRLLKLFRGIQKGRFPLLGSGAAHMDLVHVRDVARGLLLAAEHPRAAGEAFIISGGEPLPVRELIELIAKSLDVPPPRLRLPITPFLLAATVSEAVLPRLGITPPLTRRRLGFYTSERAFSIEKARSVLGYEVQYPLERGLADTIAWYRSEHLL